MRYSRDNSDIRKVINLLVNVGRADTILLVGAAPKSLQHLLCSRVFMQQQPDMQEELKRAIAMGGYTFSWVGYKQEGEQ